MLKFFEAFSTSKLKSLSTQLGYMAQYQFTASSIKEEGKNILEIIENQNELPKTRADKYLQEKFNLKWGQVQSLFRKKKVKIYCKEINAMVEEPSYQLANGDIIYYPKPIYQSLSDPAKREQKQEKELEVDYKSLELFKNMIVFEDENFLIINKLPNLSSQGGAEVKLNLYFLMNNFFQWKKTKLETDLDSFTGIVHRLDKNTTGIMALAKTRNFAHSFSKMLRKRKTITKTYLGVTEGLPADILASLGTKMAPNKILDRMKFEGVITAPLRYNPKTMKNELGDLNEEDTKDTETYYQILSFVKFEKVYNSGNLIASYILNPNLYPDFKPSVLDIQAFFADASNKNSKAFYNTIIRFNIEGGRKHQIRAHSAMVLGTPLLMDNRYGFERKSEPLMEEMFANLDFTDYKREDIVKINDKETVVVPDIKEESEIEKHYVKALVDRSFLFLHSARLEFELEGCRYDIKGGYPPYWNYYLRKVFGDEYKNIEKKFV